MSRRLSLSLVLAVGGTLLLTPGVAAGGGCIPDAGLEMTRSSERAVAIDDCAFVATVTYVDPGEEVRWINGDHVPHTVTGAARSWGSEEMVDMGDAVSYSFAKQGVYPYYCALHPTMVGAVVVGDGGGPVAAAGGLGVEAVDDAGPATSTQPGPVATGGGTSPAVLAVSIAVALGVVLAATRYALARRASAPSAS